MPESVVRLGDQICFRGAAHGPPHTKSSGLEYWVELWKEEHPAAQSVIATTGNRAVAFAAYDAALREYPGKCLVLRLGNDILACSRQLQAESAPANAPAHSSSDSEARAATLLPEPRLTAREIEVLRLLVRGLSMKHVARALGVTQRTVAFHKYKAMEANGLRNNADLLEFAIRNGLFVPLPSGQAALHHVQGERPR